MIELKQNKIWTDSLSSALGLVNPWDELEKPLRKFICFAEVKGRKGRYMDTSYPLPIAVKKLVKIQEKRSNCVLIWSCIDGIVYGKYRRLKGDISFGGMITPREGSTNDRELMAYYEKQEELKTLKY